MYDDDSVDPEHFAIGEENLLDIDQHLQHVMDKYQTTLHRQGIRQLRMALLFVMRGHVSACVYTWRRAAQREHLRRELDSLMTNSSGIQNLLDHFVNRLNEEKQ